MTSGAAGTTAAGGRPGGRRAGLATLHEARDGPVSLRPGGRGRGAPVGAGCLAERGSNEPPTQSYISSVTP